jgi:hypothetical protein
MSLHLFLNVVSVFLNTLLHVDASLTYKNEILGLYSLLRYT